MSVEKISGVVVSGFCLGFGFCFGFWLSVGVCSPWFGVRMNVVYRAFLCCLAWALVCCLSALWAFENLCV